MLKQTWEYVENNLTIPQITAYRAYWGKSPPVDLLAAAWMGYKPQGETKLGNMAEMVNLPEIEE